MKRLIIALVALQCFVVMLHAAQEPPLHWALNNLPADATYSSFQDGVAVFKDLKVGKYGAIDTQGNIIIPPTFKRMSDFMDGISIVETEKGRGVINKKGVYLLQPDSTITFSNVFGKSKYGEDEYIPGLYEVNKKNNKASGFWYQNKMTLPINETPKNVGYFPFIIWKDSSDTKDISHIINLVTGEIMVGTITNIELLRKINIPTQKGNINRLYTFFGEELQNKQASSKGVRLVTSQNSRSCSLVAQNGDTILSQTKEWYCQVPVWQNNMILMTRQTRTNKGYEFSYRLYDGSGKICFEKTKQCNDISFGLIKGNGVLIHTFDKDNISAEIYNFNGKCVLSADNFINHIYNDWFYVLGSDNKNYLYCLYTNKKFPCQQKDNISENMLVFRDYNDNYYIANVVANYCYSPKDISSINPYHEGVSVAKTKSGLDCLIDNTGTIIMQLPKDFIFPDHRSSNGVLCVRKPGWKYGYVYNPLRKNTPIFGKSEHNKWLYDQGEYLFNQKKYTQAKEKFYDIMLNDPANVDAINYYGCCLERLGYYDSAIDAFLTILKIDSNNKLAIDNIEVCKTNKQIAEQGQQYTPNQAMTWVDGLTQFFGALGNAFAQYADFTDNMNTARDSGYSGNNIGTSNSSSNRQSGSDNVNKSRDARTYSDLESQLIKMNTYPDTYNDNQRRSIQSQMRSIRTKWENRGFRMFHSSWEDWSGWKR